MSGKITLTMVKPLAVEKGYIGDILSIIIKSGFKIRAMKYLKLSIDQAKAFYKIHEDKPFYSNLVEFMSSGPIVAAILEKENAIDEYRKLIGATNPEKSEINTIRNLFGTSLEKNAVHGSDSDENAEIEADFFFSKLEKY